MILPIIMLFQLMVVLSPSSSQIIKPGCQKKCGEIPISYPFGIGAGCYLEDSFAINCRSSKAFLARINLEVLNISLEANTILVNHPVFNTCGSAVDSKVSANLENSPFFFSHTRNKLFGQGCYFLAYINHNQTYAGCYSSCFLERDPTTVCLGIHCCHSPIPPFLQFFNASVEVTTDNPDIVEECRLVFVVQEDWLLRKKWNPGNSKAVPVVLDWGIHNSSFHLLNITTSTSTSHCNVFTNAKFANKSFSTSTTASNSPFYQCNCNRGFQGNPYLLKGCKDIDECKNKSICSPKMSCRNVKGSYKCDPKLNTALVILGVVTGLPSLLLVLIGAWRLHIMIKRRKNIKVKEKYFKCLLMQQHLTLYDGSGDRGRLFKSKELDKATNHFNVNRILGRGGQGLEEGKSLVNHFMDSMQEDNLFDILDPQVKQLGKKEEIVTIANLVNNCLNVNGKKRPTMKEVAMVLEGIQASSQKDNGNVQQDYEEVEYETHERTEITECWDVDTTSTG
ncbi:hypothetical protein QYF36_006918 [Acer negundo]|nr:hypothetical protein QYF36_006918 [Acer negundo]